MSDPMRNSINEKIEKFFRGHSLGLVSYYAKLGAYDNYAGYKNISYSGNPGTGYTCQARNWKHSPITII